MATFFFEGVGLVVVGEHRVLFGELLGVLRYQGVLLRHLPVKLGNVRRKRRNPRLGVRELGIYLDVLDALAFELGICAFELGFERTHAGAERLVAALCLGFFGQYSGDIGRLLMEGRARHVLHELFGAAYLAARVNPRVDAEARRENRQNFQGDGCCFHIWSRE